ncbi:MAG: hypothetical protein MZW92_63725 [Comamonadaceae bacterium]|nr:hypothetical protein [Comamonadaceae bacterium]
MPTHQTTGAVGPKSSPEQLLTFEIPLPELDEQRRIVAELEKQFSRLDEAVANLKRVKANAQHFARATIQTLTSSSSFGPKVRRHCCRHCDLSRSTSQRDS